VTRWNDVDLDAVDTVEDFAIELRELEDCGKIVHYISASMGELAWFPGWEHADRDLRHFVASDVPLGMIDDPFEDNDEGWRIVIFEESGFVYVLEDDRPTGTRFPRRFRVPKNLYFFAWAALINQYNPMVSLDDLFTTGDA